ncbi:MAG: redoxin domain-containing protein [Deferrisomatales bacterium]|nr:redoxin domain-containing protein [Deferrisomatales bacterium]
MNPSRRRSWAPWLLLLLWLPATTLAAHLDVVPGQPFPNLEFPSLLDPTDYERLGLDRAEGPVRLTDIPGPYLAIEFFNKSCRPCQSQVREMETYYQGLLAAGAGTPAIRVLAVAVGNQPEYLPKYRLKRGMTYPIAADPEFEQWRRLGEPGRTPFTVFLRREGDGWVLNSYHFGIQGRDRLAENAAAMLAGREAPVDGLDVPPSADRDEEMPISPEALESLAEVLFERVGGRKLPVEALDMGVHGIVYRTRIPLSGRRLYARAATRAPVCEVCHAVEFMFVFDDVGVVLTFEPIQVTKYGNAFWNEEDLEHFTNRLRGRRIDDLKFDSEVDTVTSATMTSALIYDEVRRTRALLERLRDR